ncbi:MAG: hypothetical protein KAI43_05270 [Candidatus Aureabacteria bacterium]|nr:hypothetical protein [Candidatus Auribacterota bacterium]
MQRKIKKYPIKRGRPKGSRKKHIITYEILPPGTLKKKFPDKPETAVQRWEEILEICTRIIAENSSK